MTRGRLAKLLLAECGAFLPAERACEGQPPQPCTDCAASGNEGAPDEQIDAMEQLCRMGILNKLPNALYKPCEGVINAEFAVVVMHALNFEPADGDFDQWWGRAFETLKKSGLLPPEDAQNPAGPPSEEFIRRLIAFCRR